MDYEKRESPKYIRLSLAAALTLGFKNGSFYRNAKLSCINLLLTYANGCVGNCAYCGLSGKRPGSFHEKSFIRVEWPVEKFEEVLDRIELRTDGVKRICLSMIANARAPSDLIGMARRIRRCRKIPLSLLVTPTIVTDKDLMQFKDTGADRLGIAIDTATETLFEKYRGKGVRAPHRWDRYWSFFEKSVKIFGKNHVGSHLIVGLGETEKEMVETIQKVKDLGGTTHLFSFYPESGSLLDGFTIPPLGQYRRIQLARYLIDEGRVSFGKMGFNSSDQIIHFGIDDGDLVGIIDAGRPFMTSGCPDDEGNVACNRPYGNSRPGLYIRNYPFPLETEDTRRVQRQIWRY
ncbi:MAG: radical SAM protein [Thermodesulfobacteriota bacterium]